jgi:hypothetical protein
MPISLYHDQGHVAANQAFTANGSLYFTDGAGCIQTVQDADVAALESQGFNTRPASYYTQQTGTQYGNG